MTLDTYQLDALKEVINIGVGKSSSVLSEMVDQKIELSVPTVNIIKESGLKEALLSLNTDLVSMVNMNFDGGFNGSIMLAFPPESANNMVATLSEDDYDADIDSIKSGAIIEVGNIVLNGILGSISNILDDRLHYSVPAYYEDTIINLVQRKVKTMKESELLFLFFETRFNINHLEVSGDILLFMEISSFNSLILKLEQFIDKA